jgi:SAM-dependent methyltransferase
VTVEDRVHWDERYEQYGAAPEEIEPPPLFGAFEDVFPTSGSALEIACGRGRVAVWLAARGLQVWGVDVSQVAIELACELARRTGLGGRCRFDVADLDDGLPAGDPVDVVVCHFFRDARLDAAIIDRLAPGGLLAIAACSEVDVGPGRFRSPPGELVRAFADLDVIESGEAAGSAWLLGRRPPP